MKKIFILLIAFLLPVAAFANTVEVYPTIHNSHGGTASAADITVCATVDGQQSCDTGVPNFDAPIGSTYHVSVTPPSGYSYSTHGDCDGTVAGDDASIICFVDYSDGAKVIPVASQPVVAPTPMSEPVAAPAPSIESGVAQIASSTEDTPDIAALRAELVSLLKQLIALLQAQLATQQ